MLQYEVLIDESSLTVWSRHFHYFSPRRRRRANNTSHEHECYRSRSEQCLVRGLRQNPTHFRSAAGMQGISPHDVVRGIYDAITGFRRHARFDVEPKFALHTS